MEDDHKVVVVTGASGLLGEAICKRIMDQMPDCNRLTIVVTSRNLQGAKQIIKKLKEYSIDHPKENTIEFDYVCFDLLDMVSILGACYELRKRFARIHCLLLNASYSNFDGIDWPLAFKLMLTSPYEAFTVGAFKIQPKGVRTKDGQGAVFQGNVVGPWYMVNELKEQLSGGKVVWFASCISVPRYYNSKDIELLESDTPYESAKYEVELLHYASYRELKGKYNIESWLVQPGVSYSTSLVPSLNIFAFLGMLIGFYFCRLVGSPYHCITSYKGANAPAWLCCEADSKKDELSYKYGSATNRWGTEYILKEDKHPPHANELYDFVEGKRLEWVHKLEGQIVERETY